MGYEVWKEPGAKGRTFYVFYGLKLAEQATEAVRIIAADIHVGKLKLLVHDGCVKNDTLYIDGYIPGTKKVHVITRKGV